MIERRRSLAGYATGVLSMSNLVTTPLHASNLRNITVTIYDENALPRDQRLVRAVVADRAGDIELMTTSARPDAPTPLDWTVRVPVADRTWRIEVSPTAAYFTRDRPWYAWMVLIIGLFVSSMLGVLLLGVCWP